METITPDSDLFREINSKIINAVRDISDQTINDHVISIYDSYANRNENLSRVRLSAVALEGRKDGKETYKCYFTLYLHGLDVNSRAEILSKFLKDGLAVEIFENFGFRLSEISNSRDASRNLGRGNVENRSSFSLSLKYERFV